MSWRTATKTSGFGITVDYTPGRPVEALPTEEAKAIVDRGAIEQRTFAHGHPLAAAFHDATAVLLRAVEAAFPGAKVEVVTSGHVDDVNGGYGSIAINIHAA